MLWLNLANIALQIGLLASSGTLLIKAHRTHRDAMKYYRDAMTIYTKTKAEVETVKNIEFNTLSEIELLKHELAGARRR